jgi:hypothetical protein
MLCLETTTNFRKSQAVSWEFSYSYKSCTTFFSYIYTRSPFVFSHTPANSLQWLRQMVFGFCFVFFCPSTLHMSNHSINHLFTAFLARPSSSSWSYGLPQLSHAWYTTYQDRSTQLHQSLTRCNIRTDLFIVGWFGQIKSRQVFGGMAFIMMGRRTGGLSRDR